jgi:serine/threonine-protein kinase HipA
MNPILANTSSDTSADNHTIAVYGDWEGLPAPLRLGLLHSRGQSARETLEFECDPAALGHPALVEIKLGSTAFGAFEDAGPGPWGRMLMRSRLASDRRNDVQAEQERGESGGEQSHPLVRPQPRATDYLLGVQDILRSGALRFRLNDAGDFLDDRDASAIPSFLNLRELEAASLSLQQEQPHAHSSIAEWLELLAGPGGSLGGARPKAAVADPAGYLWTAKFPDVTDAHDVGAWEMVAHTLARACGLLVTDSLAKRFSGDNHTFLARRFDRTDNRQRLHFVSAMTLTGRTTGDDAMTGAGYLDIARILIDQGAQTDADLLECWSRIVFNVLISNDNDGLRNHGFILVPGKGWRLSELYSLSPSPQVTGSKLNISPTDNALQLDLVRSVAPYFRIDVRSADDIIDRSKAVVRQWPKIATRLGLSLKEREWMRPAFRSAN